MSNLVETLSPGAVVKRALQSDLPEELLQFAVQSYQLGGVAIAFLSEIRGGAAKAIGSPMVITEDGLYAGYVSGGCVEAAVASEAVQAIAADRDKVVRYGEGSLYFDIVLPCGGGISITIHVLKSVHAVQQALTKLGNRIETTLCYNRDSQSLYCVETTCRPGWDGECFSALFRPRTRIVVSGHALEVDAVERISLGSAYDTIRWDSIVHGGDPRVIDDHSAVLLLHHDLDRETQLLRLALQSKAFYIGALGSTRTHRKRVKSLEGSVSAMDLARIKAPIGLFGPARDSTSLALSVVADVAAARLAIFG